VPGNATLGLREPHYASATFFILHTSSFNLSMKITTAADLPRHCQKVCWKTFFATAAPGDVFQILCADEAQAINLRSRSSKSCREHGKANTTLMDGSSFIITITEHKPRLDAQYSNSATDIAAAEARQNNIPARIRQADENAAYWLRQIALRIHPEAKAQARGTHAAWKMTAARLREDLNARSLATA